MAIEKIKILGAEYLSYVKSIATYAPTFFGYIISVLAIVFPIVQYVFIFLNDTYVFIWHIFSAFYIAVNKSISTIAKVLTRKWNSCLELSLSLPEYFNWFPFRETKRTLTKGFKTSIQDKRYDSIGGFHQHLLVFSFVYQFYSRIEALVKSSFPND